MRRAVCRLILGQLQVCGATVGTYFLLTFGAAKPTIIAVAATAAVSLTSRILFGYFWTEEREREAGKQDAKHVSEREQHGSARRH